MTKVLKTCNLCLECNHRPALMGVRAKIKYCRRCHTTTVWSPMEASAETAYWAENARREAFLPYLLEEEVLV